MKKHSLPTLAIICTLLSGCFITPDQAPRVSTIPVPPPGFTPQSIAAKKVLADANLNDAQKQANEIQAAIAQATAIAEATQSAHTFSVKQTQDALTASLAQAAATATAQSIAADTQATQQAINAQATQQAIDLAVHATQTAVAMQAAISATAQTAYERKVAFDQTAAINTANLTRENDSANFRTVLYSLAFIVLIAICLWYLRDLLRTKVALAKIVKTPMGEYKMRLLKDGVVVFEPMLSLPAPIDQTDIIEAPDDQPAPRTITVDPARPDRTFDAHAGDADYWKWEKLRRSESAELLYEAMNSIGAEGQTSKMLPGHKEMGWSGETHDRYKKPIARYFKSKPGWGSVLIDDRYPTLYALYLGVKSHAAPIDVFDNEGQPIPLTRSG